MIVAHRTCLYFFALLSLSLTFAMPALTHAHCDSMDGPVVADAERALSTKSVDPVLKWIPAEDEEQIKKTFNLTLKVREESEAAKEVADRYFMETLIRLHRASEGEGFTGIKPAGSTAPGIQAADKALEQGSAEELADKIASKVREAILDRFKVAHTKKQSAEKSTKLGREYVEAYVDFTHFVEGVDHLLSHGASHKHRETTESEQH